MVSRYMIPPIAVGALLMPVARAAEPPSSYCLRRGVDDALRPIPALLVPAAKRLFGLDAPDGIVKRTTVFRCMDSAVFICTIGANLPCGKMNTNRSLASVSQYCQKNPDASMIPMVVTGHDTIYAWRCRGREALAGDPTESLDARGFLARVWKAPG